MRKRKIITVGALLLLAFIACQLLSRADRPQVVGSLASVDLRDILHLVRNDLREKVLPSMEWDDLFHPSYVVSSIGDYHAQHILWAEVHPDGEVEVFAGVSKERIHDEGYVWSLRKDLKWEITGYGYWGSSNVAPAGIRVPSSL